MPCSFTWFPCSPSHWSDKLICFHLEEDEHPRNPFLFDPSPDIIEWTSFYEGSTATTSRERRQRYWTWDVQSNLYSHVECCWPLFPLLLYIFYDLAISPSRTPSFFFSAWTLNFKPFSLGARSRFLHLIPRFLCYDVCITSFFFFMRVSRNRERERERVEKIFIKFLEKKFFFRFFHLVWTPWMEILNKLAYRLDEGIYICVCVHKLVYTDEDGTKFYLREISLTPNSTVLR